MYSDVVIFIKRNQLTDAFCFIDPLKMRESDFLTEADAYPQLPTQANFFTIFKLIQHYDMVILSCLTKKNQNLNSRKKSLIYY